MKLGTIPRIELVGCHRMPHRSFFWRGKQFPVCARCTGMLLGYLTFFAFLFISLPLRAVWVGLLLNVPASLDGSSQALGWRESNNWLRLATGLASGIGQIVVLSATGEWIGKLLAHLIKGGS